MGDFRKFTSTQIIRDAISDAMEVALMEEIERGVYEIPDMPGFEWRNIRMMLERYADLRIALADASPSGRRRSRTSASCRSIRSRSR